MMYRVGVIVCVCLCVQFVVCQFGFFPNERRYRQSFGFSDNYSNSRIHQKLSSILHLQSETPNSNPAFIYPFNNRPVIDDSYKQYDNRPPNNIRFPGQVPTDVNFDTNRPQNYYPGINNPSFEADKPNDPKQPTDSSNGLTFADFITGLKKPSFGDGFSSVPDQSEKKNSESNNYNENNVFLDQTSKENQFEPGTNSPVFDVSTPNSTNIFEDAFKPGYSSHSDGLIMGTVSKESAFGSGFTSDPSTNEHSSKDSSSPLIFESSSEPIGVSVGNKPSFGDRNGEDETTTLPILTPVPPSVSRQNVNFGTAGLFKQTCETVDGGFGTCIRIQTCEPYYKLLKNPRDRTAVDILRRSQCGFEGQDPKVCCPLPGIPGEPQVPQTTTEAIPDPQGKSVADPEPMSGLSRLTALPEPPVCGISEASFSRVVNGIPAKLGDFPWMALLGYKGRRGNPTRWLCGGSLVTSHHVLTAAHCIHNREDDLYVVRLGELDLAREDEGATPLDVLIRNKIKHEGYDSMAFTNDIGLLILDKDVKFTKLIRPICIPQDMKLRSLTFEKYNPLIAGWGDVAYRGPSASHLQVAQLPVVTNGECKEAFKQYKKQVIDERVLCAGWKDGRQDACQGDSGGPLMQPIWNSETYKTFFFQIGVVSFGKKCAEPGFPGVYTRVTQFVPWLQEKILNS